MATISVFVGSTRMGRQGDKVAHWVTQALKARGHTVQVIDPTEHTDLQVFTLPVRYNQNPSADMKKIDEWVKAADGYILVTPEYNHSYSGALKNALDFFLPEYEKKVFGFVTYSAGPFGGIRAAEHLHAVIPELKGIASPVSLPVSLVQNTFNEDGTLKDQAYVERLEKFLSTFEWYVDAIKAKRK